MHRAISYRDDQFSARTNQRHVSSNPQIGAATSVPSPKYRVLVDHCLRIIIPMPEAVELAVGGSEGRREGRRVGRYVLLRPLLFISY